jgi:hypothetical protein
MQHYVGLESNEMKSGEMVFVCLYKINQRKTYFYLRGKYDKRPSGLVVKKSWLQIQRSGFDSLLYQIFWEVVRLERGPLSLVSKLRSYLEEKVAAPV